MIHNINSNLLTRAVKVVLVGAGGTGSHVLRRLANMHLAMVELGHPEGLDVVVIDPDTVSKTNVGRQNFWPSDVGQHKAEILVNRCNMLMQTGWQAEIAKVTNDSRFNSQPDIVIGCVDNRKGRGAILATLKRSVYKSAYYLDIGNREHDGQVVLGEVFGSGYKRENRLPHIADLYPDIIDGSLDVTDDTPSCSLAEALEKQSLFINDTMANAACNLLWELFRYGRLTHHGQFVNIKSGRVTPLSIDPEVWKRFGYDENAKPKRRRKAVKQ
ncbi:MAG: PRTRC system ThiF family protein [Gallionella sp.]